MQGLETIKKTPKERLMAKDDKHKPKNRKNKSIHKKRKKEKEKKENSIEIPATRRPHRKQEKDER